MTVKKWSYLKKGDVVDIVATTPGIGIADLEKDLQFLSEFVNQIGLSPRINYSDILNGADFFSRSATKIRANGLSKALLAEDSKAIWFIRGGYGTSKLLPDLERISPPKIPKLLIGYSDINCLHLWVNKFWQWPTLHARVLYEFLQIRDSSDIELLKTIIFGKKSQIIFDNLLPLNDAARKAQNIYGKITGGTVQVLQSGIGLPWQFDPTDKILFLEEIFDRGVRLERSLNHFMQLGLFKKAKAIIFGDIVCGKELDGSEACDLAVKYFATELDIPVLHIPKIGHGDFNHPLPLNSDSELILNGKDAKLVCSTGGV